MSKKKSGKQRGSKESVRSATDVGTIIEDEFGHYRIRAGRLNGDFIARAFPKSSSNSQGLIAEASGTSEADAVEALKEVLTSRSKKHTEERRWEERSATAVPSKEEFIEALRQTSLTEPQVAMLKAHAIAGERGMSLAALGRAAGYKSQDTVLRTFKRAGSLVSDFLGVEIQSDRANDRQDARQVLGYCVETDTDTAALWVMHSELRDAIREAL
ncbi:hypothetical protein [Roseovarius confluentis]|uniref:hypothetical protein n=1 Tax=Roseovarius confluentis TaxID=1852027 RepID=UPI000CDD9B11|nr:hypothetical protein [Roseovarius confluentis]